MTFDPIAYRPVASAWFQTDFNYDGYGRARFRSPAGEVVGPTHVRINASGETHVIMHVEAVLAEEPLSAPLSEILGAVPVDDAVDGEPGSTWNTSMAINPCLSLTVESAGGVFTALRNIFHMGPLTALGNEIHFQVFDSWFNTSEGADVAYWVLPLQNCIAGFGYRGSCPESLERHPLRIYPTPEIPPGLNEDQRARAMLYANLMNNLIVFELNGALGFIEKLPDSKEQEAALQLRQTHRALTAVMVGPVRSDATARETPEIGVPIDYLYLLGFATGIEVGAPWLEFRDSAGRLVRRHHVQFGYPEYQEGAGAIRELTQRGTGQLLTQGVTSDYWGTSRLRVTLRHALRAGLHALPLEERLGHVMLALDGLCEELGLARQDLLARLDTTQRTRTTEILQTAVDGLLSARSTLRTAGDLVQAEVLHRIAARVRSAAQKENAFNVAVLDLLNDFNLPDAAIVEKYYRENPRADGLTWAHTLGYYRGRIIHHGYVDFTSGSIAPDDGYVLLLHLHDILTRIILKMLGYTGFYSPSMGRNEHETTVDWVHADTSARELGYGE